MANGPESDLHVPRRGYDARPPPINTAYSGPNTNQFSPKTPTPGYLPTELSPPPGNSSPQSPLTPVTPRIPISNSDSAFSENDITRVSLFFIFFFSKVWFDDRNQKYESCLKTGKSIALCVYCYNAIPLNKCRIVFEILVW